MPRHTQGASLNRNFFYGRTPGCGRASTRRGCDAGRHPHIRTDPQPKQGRQHVASNGVCSASRLCRVQGGHQPRIYVQCQHICLTRGRSRSLQPCCNQRSRVPSQQQRCVVHPLERKLQAGLRPVFSGHKFQACINTGFWPDFWAGFCPCIKRSSVGRGCMGLRLAQQGLRHLAIIQGKFINSQLWQPAGQRIKAAQGIGQGSAQASLGKVWRWRRRSLLRQQGQAQQFGIVHTHKGNVQHPGQGLPVPADAACGQAQPQALSIVQLHAKGKFKGQRARKVGDARADGRGGPVSPSSTALRRAQVWRCCLQSRIDFICQPALHALIAQGHQRTGNDQHAQQHARG